MSAKKLKQTTRSTMPNNLEKIGMNFDIPRLLDNPEEYVNAMSAKNVGDLLAHLDNHYYNYGESLVSDEIYDYIRDKLVELAPDHPQLRAIGIIPTREKVKLPYHMGSMDKIKTDLRAIDRWIGEYPGEYVLSDKLDGISGLLVVKDGAIKLYTRGNSEYGRDISHIQRLIKLPRHISSDIAVRGEFVISKSNYNKISGATKAMRNIVAGLLMAKTANNDLLRLVDFVTYECIMPESMQPSAQMDWLKSNGFNTVYNKCIKEINADILAKFFETRRNDGEYDIDGIIVTHDAVHPRNTAGNPQYAFAYKNVAMEERGEVTVIAVEWNQSKDGILVPTVVFTPITLRGAEIKRATGKNGRFIANNKIGIGAKLIISRSGDIIPEIEKVTKPADIVSTPTVEYVLSESGADYIVKTRENKESRRIAFENFVDKLDIKGVSKGTARKLFDAGIDTVDALFRATVQDIAKTPGIADKSANNIVAAISDARRNISPISVAVASNMFGRGFGEKKFQLIMDKYPSALSSTGSCPTIGELSAIRGIDSKTAQQFADNYHAYKQFLVSAGITLEYKQGSVEKRGNKLNDMTFVFSGFRDDSLEEYIQNNGGRVTSTVSRNTTMLIVKDIQATGTKIDKANELNIKIITVAQFKKYY
jgi:NAD-dependent DNA ligase